MSRRGKIAFITLIASSLITLGYIIQILAIREDDVVTVAHVAEEESAREGSAYTTEIFERTLRVEEGQTIAHILSKQGISRGETTEIISALSEHFNPKDLKEGQEIFIRCQAGIAGQNELLRLMMRPCLEHEVIVSRNQYGQFHAGKIRKQLVQQLKSENGTIRSSLFADAARLGIPQEIISEVSKGLSYDIHLQRDIQPNAPFEVIYENVYDAESGLQRPGHLVYAAIGIHGESHHIYRFETKDGRVDLYNEEGASVRKELLVTPISAARLSSGFGLRKHPVLGYSRMHKGVDFAAPKGTPIKASGDGMVVYVGRKSGYGNCIKVSHGNSYETFYAHMSKFASGLSKGSRVRQGQIIGYVGATGMASGPHLHYEVHLHGRQIDPQKIKQPPKIRLAGHDLKEFQTFKRRVQKHMKGLRYKNHYVATKPEEQSKEAG